MAPPLPHAGGARPSLERGGLSSEEAKVRLRESWPLRRNPTDTSETISLLARRWLHPCFESVIPALFWARLVRGAAVHGLRSPGSAFGFGIEIHRLRRSHPSIP